MSRTTIFLAFILLATSGLASQQTVVGGQSFSTPPTPPAGQNGQPARDTRPTTGTARIRGRVVVADTGQPARRASVRASAPEVRDMRVATTDFDGRYEIANLPAGHYSISVTKNGFITSSYGQTKPSGPVQPLTLVDRQNADDINVSLLRGAAIAGRVIDDFGDPMSGATVMAMRSQFQNGQQRIMPTGMRDTTNDLGEYRLFALTPGVYYVAATAPTPTESRILVNGAPVNGVPAPPDDRNGFAPVFYPGTSDPGSAAKLTLAAGQTAAEINLSFVGTRLARITGLAVDSQGRPMAGGNVQAMPRGKVSGLSSQGGQLRDDGTFVISNLAPGDYTLRANPRPPPPPPRPPNAPASGAAIEFRPVPAVASVTVAGDDIDGLRLAPVPLVTVHGRITFTDPSGPATVKPSSVRVIVQMLNLDDGPSAPPGPPPTLNDDFTFEVQVPAGLIMLRPAVSASAPNLPAQWVARSVRVNGIDRSDTGIEIRPNENVSDVELQLTNRIADISGNVLTARGEPATSSMVLLFPEERSLWTSPAAAGRAVATRADRDGHFVSRNIRPGRYYGVALSEVDLVAWTDPEFLQSLTGHATTFSVGEGEKKVLDLKVMQ